MTRRQPNASVCSPYTESMAATDSASQPLFREQLLQVA